MTESTAGPEEAPLTGPATDAGDIRDGGTTAPGAAIPGLPADPSASDAPDARTNPDIDEVRGSDDGLGLESHTEYGLRSELGLSHGSDQDPASYLNP